MKTLSLLAKTTYLIAMAISLSAMTSCRTDNDEKDQQKDTYFATTPFYGAKTDSTQVRNDAVGKWYDENNKLVLNIVKSYKNPDFPYKIIDGIKVRQVYWVYDLTSDVDGYPFSTVQTIGESSLYGNNINLGGNFHLIVEASNAKMWVMRNTPYKIKVTKK